MSLREEKEQQTRTQIMEAAFLLFCQNGIEATEMMRIAKKARVSRPTLYRYFESKHQLAVELYLTNLERLLELFPISQEDGLALSLVTSFLNGIVEKLEKNPLELVYDAVFNLYASRIHIDPTLLPAHPWNLPVYAHVMERFEAKLRDGSIRFLGTADNLRDTVFLPYFAYVQRLAIFSFQKGGEHWNDTLQEADRLRKFYLQTLTPDRDLPESGL